MDADLQLQVTPSVLDSPTATVSISWQGNVHAGDADWIAAYSPPPTSPEGFLTTLPVKYRNLTGPLRPGESGSTTMWLLHMRAPWVLAYMRGGFDTPTLVATSAPISYTPAVANVPMQIHLARTAVPTQMRVSWVTSGAPHPIVQWGPVAKGPNGLTASAFANTSTYTRDEMCGDMAAGLGWREPGALHTAVLDGLEAGEQYFYRVGDASLSVFSPLLSFWSAPTVSAGSDTDFIIMGDQGQAQTDGTVGWEEWVTGKHGEVQGDIDQPAAVNTSRAITQELREGTTDNRTALVLLIGDISYARGRGAMWDQYAYLAQPFAARVALMTSLGNHEIDTDWPGISLWNGTDSGGECGVPVQRRYPMPSPQLPHSHGRGRARAQPQHGFSDTPFYSFDHGSVHFAMLSSEHAFDRSSAQYAWLAADLAAVNRSATPWLIVTAHRPMYVSSSSHASPSSDQPVAALLQKEIEPLLLQYRVDVFFAGHHHSQQITCAVAHQQCADHSSVQRASELHRRDDASLADVVRTPVVSAPSAPPPFGIVHFVVGAAGQWSNPNLSPTPPDWLLYANVVDHGFTRVRVRGATMTLDFIAAADRKVLTTTTIVQHRDKPHTIDIQYAPSQASNNRVEAQ